MKGRTLTIVGLIAAILAFLWFWSSSDSSPSKTKQATQTGQTQKTTGQPGPGQTRAGRSRPSPTVVTATVSESVVNDRLKAIGSGRAAASVSVVPLSNGLLTEVAVQSGQRVEQGDVLANLDDEEEQITRDRASRAVTDAASDEARIARLYKSRTATEVELNKARTQLADAHLVLREAELNLSRRTITAPIAGIAGFVSVDKGNYVTTQTPLVSIDDRSTLIIEFWVPERFSNQVSVGQHLIAKSMANPGESNKGSISAIDSRIETDSRTLPVEAKIDNASDSLRPGMSFEVQLSFTGQTFPAVNPLAVQWGSEGSFVWRIVDNKAQQVPVLIIQRNPDTVLVKGDLSVGDQLVTEGILSLRPGATVKIQGAGN